MNWFEILFLGFLILVTFIYVYYSIKVDNIYKKTKEAGNHFVEIRNASGQSVTLIDVSPEDTKTLTQLLNKYGKRFTIQ